MTQSAQSNIQLFDQISPAPEFPSSEATPLRWFNSKPLTMKELRGQVICVDFWDYTCVNCIRTLPYMATWHNRYANLGLTIIGVHAPEFSFAHDSGNVERGIKEFELGYPVVLDNDYAIWHAFANQYWPAKYLIDHEGFIRFAHFGEGKYRQTESAIQQLLRLRDSTVTLPPLMKEVRESDKPGAVCYRMTPELYLGYRRGRLGNPEGFLHDETQTFKRVSRLEAGKFYPVGNWHCGAESLRYVNSLAGETYGTISLRYQAKELNLVMSPPEGASGLVTLKQDDRPLEPADWGRDVQALAEPTARQLEIPPHTAAVTVDVPRMYALVNNRTYGEHTLQLQFHTPGTAAFAFTFVSCVK